LQVKNAARQTTGLKILGPEGNGLIVLRQGEVVHAEYEDLLGDAAFHALMGVKAGYFEAATVADPLRRTVETPMRALLLEAHRLADLGELPRPALRAQPLRAAPSGEPVRSLPPARLWHGMGRWIYWAGGLLLLVAAIWALLPPVSLDPASVSPAPGAAEAGASEAVEASLLTGMGDRLPALLSGTPPTMPAEGSAVLPTVVCRIRIDAQGKVVEAKVYRSRLEFAELEEAAVRALEGYRFRPALQGGAPVAVWLNYPVEFR
jgi:TonB family protein